MKRTDRDFYRVFTSYLLLTACVVAAVTAASNAWMGPGSSIFDQSFFVGATARNLASGRGLLVCTEAMGTLGNPICYRGARMPVASATLALGSRLVGEHRAKLIVFLKNATFMLPLWAAVAVCLWRVRAHRKLLLATAVLLFLPMLILNYSGTIVYVDTEEDYLFGFLALAVALSISQARVRPSHIAKWILSFSFTMSALYLCKSSMLGVFLVLSAAALWQLRTWEQRLVLAGLLLLAPCGWAIRQHHVTGRYSLGTSLDGINFEKGNNVRFLDRYPDVSGALDQYDSELNMGQHFTNEWQFNDYHLRRGTAFILLHPGIALQSTLRKADVLLFTFNRYARSHYGRMQTLVVESGFLLFRMLFWASVCAAVYGGFTGRLLGRARSVVYLLFLGAYYAPYLVGFGYMRHLIITAMPVTVMLSLTLAEACLPRHHEHT